MKNLILYGYGLGVDDLRNIAKVRDKYKRITVFVAKNPEGKAKLMLTELKDLEINITSNFYKDAKRKAKEVEDSELTDLGDFGDRAIRRDPC
ncbi:MULTISPECIES: hypothetical protein [Petrotoga]|uniref:SIR2-like domain-containing protein n=1 Tax=Petrotoga sibirica TaxID=156202 RepID=A0A4R8EIJ3_9BACT|nr:MULTISPECIES: hypothetical protein [Petrotoga]TDX11814.1 hypothetical protein C8D74_11521 [Petrotoga sibirica]